MDTALVYLDLALKILGGLIAILVVVSPLTKSEIDNKALDLLRKLVAIGGKLVGAKLPPKAP